MALCTAVSKKAEFSPAGKIMYQSHCPALFPLMFFFHYGITCKSQAPGTINLFLLSCLSCPTASPNQQRSDLSSYNWHMLSGFSTWAPLRSPIHIPSYQEKCVFLVLFWQCDFWTLAWVSWLWKFVLTSLWAWPPHSQPWPREWFWHTTRRTTPIRSRREGTRQRKLSHSSISCPVDEEDEVQGVFCKRPGRILADENLWGTVDPTLCHLFLRCLCLSLVSPSHCRDCVFQRCHSA